MSEQIEIFKDIQDFESQKREETGDKNAKIIADLSSIFPYACQNMPNSIRLIGENLKVDIFTKTGKWHDIKTDKRGRFYDCEKFIRSLF